MLCPISPHKSVCLISPGQKNWDGRGDPPLPWYVSQGHAIVPFLTSFLLQSGPIPTTTSHTHPSVSSPLPNPFLLPPKWGARKSRKEVQSLHFRLRFRSLSPLFLFGAKCREKVERKTLRGEKRVKVRELRRRLSFGALPQNGWGSSADIVGKGDWKVRYRAPSLCEAKKTEEGWQAFLYP